MSEISERADDLIEENGHTRKENLEYMRAVYCMHPMVLELLDYISALEADKVAAETKQREADLMVERLIEAAKDMVWWSNCCSQDNVKQSNKAWYALIAEWRNKQATE